ncbi:MAG TPA: hypothetical protein VF266_02765 [Thermoanaerobaculia bacterium]
MKSLLGALLLLATTREPFPAGYTPSPCATPAAIAKAGKTFPQSQIAQIAALRGYDVGQEWVDAHWKELSEGLQPIWAKAATCFVTAANDNLFCSDIAAAEAFTLCDRYSGSDREKCIFTMTAITAGQDHNSKEAWTAMRDCAAQHHQPATERTLDWWLVPAAFGPDYSGVFHVYALDSETRVPVQARLHIQSAQSIYADDAPSGLPTTFYKVPWKVKLFRVPNAQGHRDVVAPEVRIEAPGYRAETFRLPVQVPVMKAEMKPAKLKRGRNKVTITAVDAATGKPVEARVMGGERVLGKTNEPFELEITGRQPEIWITNLYDRYSDVVVAPAKK